MGYALKVRLASFFAGAATASCIGFYILDKDYKVAHQSIFQQIMKYSYLGNDLRKHLLVEVKSLHESLDRRISALENLKQTEVSQPMEGTE